MGFRNIYIENPARLSIKNRQLIISQDQDISVPVDDIDSIVIDSLQCTLTAPTISFLAENQVVLYTCNKQHMPCAVLNPLGNHSRKLIILQNQMGVTKRFKDRAWQKIIRQKVLNQARCLELTSSPNVAELNQLATQVLEGDKSFKESSAAALYFHSLFDTSFNRRHETVHNAALNYGYAIVRGAIARDLCAYGFEPALGIHHHNELNAFNLADDLIEPFRPYVDLWVAQNVDSEEKVLTSTYKRDLVSLLFTEVKIDNELHSLTNAIRKTVASYTNCCRNNTTTNLKLPELISLRPHEYE